MKRDAQQDLAVCNAATDGPWEVGYGKGITGPTSGWLVYLDGKYGMELVTKPGGADGNYSSVICGMPRPCGADDMQFIALSREALPHWINRAVELEKALGEVRDALEWLLNLAYGVGKASDERGPEPGEMEAALEDGKKVFALIKEVLS